MLESTGITVHSRCRSGAEAIRMTEKLNGGVIVCGFKFPDMTAEYLASCVKENTMVLLLANAQQLRLVDDSIFKLPFPVSKSDLAASVRMLIQIELNNFRKTVSADRTAEKATVLKAKELLMSDRNMSEEDAYRYIQKRSMDSGCKMYEVARHIIKNEI